MRKSEIRESVVLENEGQKIFGVFHRPIGEGKFPAVLMCHGFAGQKTGRGRLYVMLSELLTKSGIASLRIDFRGCGDSEGHFDEMTLYSQVSDVLKAIGFLKKHPHIDNQRIALFGRSLGGLIAVLASKKDVQALALWAPLFDGNQWLQRWKAGIPMVVDGQQAGENFLDQLFGLDMKKELEAIHSIPLFHAHGLKDSVVDLAHADHYQRERKNLTTETKFLRLPNSDHEFSDPVDRAFLIQTMLNWLQTQLKKT